MSWTRLRTTAVLIAGFFVVLVIGLMMGLAWVIIRLAKLVPFWQLYHLKRLAKLALWPVGFGWRGLRWLASGLARHSQSILVAAAVVCFSLALITGLLSAAMEARYGTPLERSSWAIPLTAGGTCLLLFVIGEASIAYRQRLSRRRQRRLAQRERLEFEHEVLLGLEQLPLTHEPAERL